MRRLMLAAAGLALLAPRATAGIREAELRVAASPRALTFTVVDASPRPVRVQRLSFRRPAGVRWALGSV